MLQNLFFLTLAILALSAGAAAGFKFNRPDRSSGWMPSGRNSLLLLAAGSALLLAAVIRYYGVDFGLPDPYHPDEFRKSALISKMVRRGTLRPLKLLHPPLLLYLTIWLHPLLSALQLYPEQWNKLAEYLLSGRMVSATAGSLTVVFVYLAGRNLRSPLTGTAAALLTAVAPLHVTCSRYLKEDILFTMFFCAALWAALCGLRLKKKGWIYFSGFLCGVSAASKYSGLISGALLLPLLLPAAADYLGTRRRAAAVFFISCCCIILGFAAASPYVLIQPSEYLRGFYGEFTHASTGHMGAVITSWSQLWVYHLQRSLIPGMGFAAVMLGLFGAGLAAGRRDLPALCAASALAAFYLSAEFAKSKPFPNPDRYVVQCVPLLALLAFYGVETVFSGLRNRAGGSSGHAWGGIPGGFAAAALIFLTLIVPPAAATAGYAADLKYDTRRQMRSFIAHNIAPGSQIATIGGKVYLPRIPNAYKSTSLRKIIGPGESNFGERLDQAAVPYLVLTEMVAQRFRVEQPDETRFQKMVAQIEARYDVVTRIESSSGSNGFHNPVLTLYRLKNGA